VAVGLEPFNETVEVEAMGRAVFEIEDLPYSLTPQEADMDLVGASVFVVQEVKYEIPPAAGFRLTPQVPFAYVPVYASAPAAGFRLVPQSPLVYAWEQGPRAGFRLVPQVPTVTGSAYVEVPRASFRLTPQVPTVTGTPTDPDFANVSLLLPLNGTNGGTVITDASVNAFTVTPVGNAQTSTAEWKWDGSSLLLEGTGDYLDIAADADFQFPGDFTIEAWVRPTAASGTRTIIELGTYLDGVLIRSFASGLDSVYVNGTAIGQTGAFSINSHVPANSWTYVQVKRASNVVTVSTDGVSRLTATTVTGTVNSANAAVRIGEARHTSGNEFQGNIQAVRVTKAVARAITTPTGPFPTS
jgi:hypothetical protein